MLCQRHWFFILHPKCKNARLCAIIQSYVFTLSMESILKSKKVILQDVTSVLIAIFAICMPASCVWGVIYIWIPTLFWAGIFFVASKQFFSDIFIRACNKALIEISCFWTCVLLPRFSACCHTWILIQTIWNIPCMTGVSWQ